jgi:probable phosphoglycerate mutase
MTRLIIWRHGRTRWNATQRWQGQTDVDLDDTGVAQAEEAAPRLAAYRPDVIFSSDLRRTARTAAALAAVTALRVEVDPRLRERHFGPWQGLTTTEVQERFPDDFARWSNGRPLLDPAIESQDDLAKRVGAALQAIADRVGDGTAVVVTHGGAARVGCCLLLGWPPETWLALGVLGNCRYSELRHTAARGWRLLAHNVA